MIGPTSRIILLVLQGHLGLLTALSGTALVLGSLSKQVVSPLTPAPGFLDGSVFSSYLLPGLILLFALGVPHLLAFVRTWRQQDQVPAVAFTTGSSALVLLVLQLLLAPTIFPLGLIPGSMLVAGAGQVVIAARAWWRARA